MTTPGAAEQIETYKEAASRWSALKRSGEMTAQQATELQLWLDRAPEHRDIFERMERLWGMARDVRDSPEMLALREDEARALRREWRRRRRSRLTMAIAASLAVIVMGAGAVVGFGLFDGFGRGEIQEFHTGIGQTTTVNLEDGTVVTLDTNTVLRAQETGRKRLVDLERGRAFFRVAKDSSRPFVVSAGGKTVTAVGTAFDIRVDPGELQVTLVDGRVTVQEPRGQFWRGQSADVMAGWRLVARDSQQWTVSRSDVAKDTAWLHGRLFFDGEPLSAVVEEMNRYSDRKVVVTDARIASTPILGAFKAGDTDGFVRMVQAYDIARVVSRNETAVELGAPRK